MNPDPIALPLPPTTALRGFPGPTRKIVLGIAAAALVLWASPAAALAAGMVASLLPGRPVSGWTPRATRWLLQGCVTLLGFSMDLGTVLRAGLQGSVFAAVTIAGTLGLGLWLGRRLRLGRGTSLLIAAGTAICGGSAIAAVGAATGASEAEMAVSMGTIFLLNAVALAAFPAVGHLLHMGQGPFGLWTGVAIHDISSVVGAGMAYGNEALQAATAVKLSRTLWIVPLTLAIAVGRARRRSAGQDRPGLPEKPASAPGGAASTGGYRSVALPWFIGLFLAASLLRSTVPAVAAVSPVLAEAARRGMVLVLFLIGTTLSLESLRAVGWRAVAAGLILWTAVSAGSLAAILGLGLAP